MPEFYKFNLLYWPVHEIPAITRLFFFHDEFFPITSILVKNMLLITISIKITIYSRKLSICSFFGGFFQGFSESLCKNICFSYNENFLSLENISNRL